MLVLARQVAQPNRQIVLVWMVRRPADVGLGAVGAGRVGGNSSWLDDAGACARHLWRDFVSEQRECALSERSQKDASGTLVSDLGEPTGSWSGPDG
jgi:hypothetical protein